MLWAPTGRVLTCNPSSDAIDNVLVCENASWVPIHPSAQILQTPYATFGGSNTNVPRQSDAVQVPMKVHAGRMRASQAKPIMSTCVQTTRPPKCS